MQIRYLSQQIRAYPPVRERLDERPSSCTRVNLSASLQTSARTLSTVPLTHLPHLDTINSESPLFPITRPLIPPSVLGGPEIRHGGS